MSHPAPLTPQGATIVVESRNFNFSTEDSSATNPNANDCVRDSLVYSEKSELSRTGHTVVAVFLGVILLLGFISNFFVLLLFARFQVMGTPINLILLNISVSDMLVCIFGTPFSFAASLYGRCLIGDQGCKWYGFANTLFGIVSLVSLAVLSYERYSTILSYTKADPSDYKKAWLAIAGTWLYSLVWTVPPFFGWSSYGPEGPGTICSVQWHQRYSRNISYVTCLFIFCLLLPLLLMVICYGKILFFICGFYRCFLAFMSCGSEPTGSHTLCTLPSSRVTGPNGNSPCPRGAWYIPWYMQAPGQ